MSLVKRWAGKLLVCWGCESSRRSSGDEQAVLVVDRLMRQCREIIVKVPK